MDPCVIWPGSKDGKGYGQARDGSSAHREVFAAINGYYPPVVRHSCDTPPCVQPSHLLAGTQADNVADMVERGRVARQPGESNGRSKLTERDVLDIRQALNAGKSVRSTAALYGVERVTVIRIRDGVSWQHVPTP